MTNEELRQPTLLVLTALTAGPRHGYALIEAVAELSAGRVRLRPGSLYGALDRLAREGLVREAATEVVSGRHRRYYELTDAGADVLSAEVGRLERLTREAAAGLRRRAAQRGRGHVGPAELSPSPGRA